MKSLFSLVLFFLPFISLFAQSEATWTLYQTVNGVEIYTQEVDCYAENIPSQKAYLIKIVNTNSYECSIEWDLAVWYNDVLQSENVKDGENHYTTVVKANSDLVGNCETPYGALYVYKDFILYDAPSKLTRFELENIKTNKK